MMLDANVRTAVARRGELALEMTRQAMLDQTALVAIPVVDLRDGGPLSGA